MYDTSEAGRKGTRARPILVAGAHDLPLPRDELWQLLRDPEILKQSVKGAKEVIRTTPDTFRARIGMGVGPIRVTVKCRLRIHGEGAPEHFCLDAILDVGLLGSARSDVDVYMLSTAGGCSCWVNYLTELTPSGPLGLMLRLREDKLARYLDWFFERLLRAAGY